MTNSFDAILPKKVKHQLWPLDRKIRVIEQVVKNSTRNHILLKKKWQILGLFIFTNTDFVPFRQNCLFEGRRPRWRWGLSFIQNPFSEL